MNKLLIILLLVSLFHCSLRPMMQNQLSENKKICIILELKNNPERTLLEKFERFLNQHFTQNYKECDYVLLVSNDLTKSEISDFSGVILQSQITVYTTYALFKAENIQSKEKLYLTLKENNIYGKTQDVGSQFTGIGSGRMNSIKDISDENIRVRDKYQKYYDIFSSFMKPLRTVPGIFINSGSFTINPNLFSATYQNEVDTIESIYGKIAENLYYQVMIILKDEKAYLDRDLEIEIDKNNNENL